MKQMEFKVMGVSMSDDKLDEAVFARQKEWAEGVMKIAVGVLVAIILVSLYVLLQA